MNALIVGLGEKDEVRIRGAVRGHTLDLWREVRRRRGVARDEQAAIPGHSKSAFILQLEGELEGAVEGTIALEPDEILDPA